MKTNQTFSAKRFGKYALCNLRLELRFMGIYSAVAFTAIVLFLLVSSPRNWGNNDWGKFWMTSTILSAVIVASSAFAFLRSREKSIGFLMLPVSVTEKFFYEILLKFIFWNVLFQLIFVISSKLGIEGVKAIHQFRQIPFNLKPFSYTAIAERIMPNKDMQVFLSLGFFVSSIAFAGTVTFRRYPLLKTIASCGALTFLVAAYINFITRKLKIRHPFIVDYFEQFSQKTVFQALSIAISISAIVLLLYTFFKLKEKEAL
jgi:hypothetical protein